MAPARLPRVTCVELIRVLKRAGFQPVGQRGSHMHLRRHTDNKRVTVPVHKGRIVPLGTLRAIIRDADIQPEDLLDFL